MAGTTHIFVSGKTDPADSTLIKPSNWNDVHKGAEWYRVTADIVKSDLTLADITGLTGIALAANEIIAFEARIYHLSPTVTNGMSFAVNGPASPTYLQLVGEFWTSATAGQIAQTTSLATKITSTAQLATVTSSYLHGIFENGGNAGNFALQWSPETAVSATIKRGSWLNIYRF